MEKDSRNIELEKQIDAYIKGRLSEEEAIQLWVKLLQRPDYMDLLETELAVKTVIEEKNNSLEKGEADSFNSKMKLSESWKWLSAAAAVVLLIVAVNILKMDSVQNIESLALSKINIAENLASPPVTRNQRRKIETEDSLLSAGFKQALSGQLSSALKIYETVIDTDGNRYAVVQAYLNIGIIRYNNGEYRRAAKALEEVLDRSENDDIIQEKAYWFLANANLKLENYEQAREAVYNTYKYKGIYRKSAFRMLMKLDYELGNIDLKSF